MKTIGQNIASYRKKKGITQEKLAEVCNVTPQAVSKWENDLSCPDIAILRLLAHTLGVTVDELLNEEDTFVALAPSEDKKGKMLRIRVLDGKDKVNVNIPIPLIELLLKNGLSESILGGENKKGFNLIDFEQVMRLVSCGAVGKLVEVESEDGELVEVWVE